MTGNLLLALTTLAYLALAMMNLQKTNATGERLVGWALISFVLIAIYVLCSLLLTISVASRGGFDWLSTSSSTRKLLTALLWLAMTIGVVFCSMLSTEFSLDRTTGIVRAISMPVYFGSLWLPLLMLIPYAILINPEWRQSVAPAIYKVPLLIAGSLGLIIVLAPKIIQATGITVPQQSSEDWYYKNLTQSIPSETNFDVLIQYVKDEDERIRSMAASKIKENPDWEKNLIQKLDRTDEYGHYDYYWAYMFMDQNKLPNPDRFIDPVNRTIPAISAAVKRALEKSFLYTGDLTLLNIDVVCRVLEAQFNDSSHVFRPHMLELLQALEAPPVNTSEMSEDFHQLLSSYTTAVKGWLEAHP